MRVVAAAARPHLIGALTAQPDVRRTRTGFREGQSMRHWAPRHIGMLWVAALLVQLVILLPWMLDTEAEDRGNATDPVVAVPIDTVMRGRVVHMLRDSLGIELAFRGDTIASASLNARGDSVVRPALQSLEASFSQTIDDLWWQLILAVLLSFSPLLIAATLTVTWWLLRRPARPEIAAGDA